MVCVCLLGPQSAVWVPRRGWWVPPTRFAQSYCTQSTCEDNRPRNNKTARNNANKNFSIPLRKVVAPQMRNCPLCRCTAVRANAAMVTVMDNISEMLRRNYQRLESCLTLRQQVLARRREVGVLLKHKIIPNNAIFKTRVGATPTSERDKDGGFA